jgi:hypothetical protein
MNIKVFPFYFGLGLTFTSTLVSQLVCPTLAQTVQSSDTGGVSVTSSVQAPAATSSPTSSSSVLIVTFPGLTVANSVDRVAITLKAPGSISGTQTFTNQTGQTVTITVPVSVANAVSTFLSAKPSPLLNRVVNPVIKTGSISSVNFSSQEVARLIASGDLSGCFLAGILKLSELECNSLSKIPVGQFVSKIAELNKASPEVVTAATALSISLQGLTHGGSVNPKQLLVAVKAYNALITAAANSPGGINALGPQILGIQAALGKMVDAAIAAANRP